jgi:hypothetical protein
MTRPWGAAHELHVDARDNAESARALLQADINERERTRQPTIAVDPMLNLPRLRRPIPYVPETITGDSLEGNKSRKDSLTCDNFLLKDEQVSCTALPLPLHHL